MINVKTFTRLIVLFVLTFTIFVSSSIAVHHVNLEMNNAAANYDASHNTTISDSVHPILVNYATAFQIIFFILAIGIGFAILVSLITGRGVEYEDY